MVRSMGSVASSIGLEALQGCGATPSPQLPIHLCAFLSYNSFCLSTTVLVVTQTFLYASSSDFLRLDAYCPMESLLGDGLPQTMSMGSFTCQPNLRGEPCGGMYTRVVCHAGFPQLTLPLLRVLMNRSGQHVS